jgi:hypothetical protein
MIAAKASPIPSPSAALATTTGATDSWLSASAAARGVVAREPDRERPERRPHPLDHPARDQHLERATEGADQRAGGERGDRHEQQAPLPVDVPQPAEHRSRRDGCEEEACHQPGGGGERGVLGLLNRGQDRDHDELLEPEVECPEHEHCGGEPIAPHGGLSSVPARAPRAARQIDDPDAHAARFCLIGQPDRLAGDLKAGRAL